MRKSLEFLGVTIGMVLFLAFCITETAKCQSSSDFKADREYYREWEQKYVREVREYLAEQGYENSGVMLTYISGGENTRKYTITVHNEKINELPEEKKTILKNSILSMAFKIPGCTFSQEFLSI